MRIAPSVALLSEPYWYRHLPRRRDVHFLEQGVVAITGNTAVREALSHPALVAEHPLKASARVLGPNVLDADGAEHRAFRALLAPVLSSGKVAEYRRDLIPRLSASLAADLVGLETDDFYGRYAHLIPYGIVCDILGIAPSLQGRMHTLTRPLASLLDYPTTETEQTHISVTELLELIEFQRAAQHGDGVSLLETIERTRDRKSILMSDNEVRTTALLFFIAGTETSSAYITSLVYCMGRLMFALDELGDRSLQDSFIEEVLRLFPPVQTAVRFAVEDVDIAGVTVPRHSAVLASIAGANRDPCVFSRPDHFLFGRSAAGSVPFATGAHACPGAALAKAEFGVFVEHLIARVGGVEITQDRHRMKSQSFSHPTGFTIRFIPAKGA